MFTIISSKNKTVFLVFFIVIIFLSDNIHFLFHILNRNIYRTSYFDTYKFKYGRVVYEL